MSNTSPVGNHTSASPISSLQAMHSSRSVFLALFVPITLVLLPWLIFYANGNLPGDTAHQFLPFKAVAAEAIRAGELPLWNPYLFSGSPLLADPQNTLLYPAQILFLLLPLPAAFVIVQYAHILWMAWGMFWLLRLYVSPVVAVAGTLMFVLSGAVVFRLREGILVTILVLAWIPWIFFCVEKYWRSRRPVWVIGAAAALGLQLLGGFPTLTFYMLIAIAVLTLYRLVPLALEKKWGLALRSAAWMLGMVVLGVALAGAQLLPTAEFIAQSSRSAPSYEFVKMVSLPFTHVLTILVPDIFGSATTETAIFGAYWGEMNIYVGALPVLVLLIYTLLLWRRRPTGGLQLYLLLTVMFLILAFGANNPAYRFLYPLPIFNQLADPGRMTMMYVFCLSVAAAISLEQASAALPLLPARLQGVLRWLTVGAAVALALALVVLTFGRGLLTPMAERLMQARYGADTASKLAELDTFFWTLAISVSVLLVVVVVGGALLDYRIRSRISREQFLLAALVIIVLDVGLYAVRMVATMRIADTAAEPAYVGMLRELPQPYRILPLETQEFTNKSSRYGIPSIIGYNPLISSRYMQLLGVVRGSPVDPADRVPAVTSIDSPLLNVLNVRYVLSLQPLDENGLTPIYENRWNIYDLGRSQAQPAFMVYNAEYYESVEDIAARMSQADFDPFQAVILEGQAAQASQSAAGDSQVSIAEQRFNRLTLDVSTSQAGWLVMGDSYFPGWSATVNGQPAPIERAYLALRALRLPAGEHRVELVYEPTSVRTGLVVSVVAALVILVTGVLFLRKFVILPLQI